MNPHLKKILFYAKKNKIEKILPQKLKRIIKYFCIDNGYKREKRPCHYRELFIQSNGNVYPCCVVWGRKDLLIGHISDKDLMNKILNFNPPFCSCYKGSIRKISSDDIFKYDDLNVELSLACQAKCAMCCVNAPDYKGSYDYYDDIIRLINELGQLNKIWFQGGEVLIQKKSLKFIEDLRLNYLPDTWFHIISNGNVKIPLIETLVKFLDSITISIVGFQDETYKKIMGLDLQTTKNFAENIIKKSKIKVRLKYLITPLNIHETNLFLNWALKLAPDSIQLIEAGGYENYIRTTKDDFWNKITERSMQDIRSELTNCDKSILQAKGTKIIIQNLAKYQIDYEFINQNCFQGIISEWAYS